MRLFSWAGDGIDMGIVRLSWEIQVDFGSPKDRRVQRETEASAHGSQPPEGLPNPVCPVCSYFSPCQPALVLLNFTKPAEGKQHIPVVTLSSVPQSHPPVTSAGYRSVPLDQQTKNFNKMPNSHNKSKMLVLHLSKGARALGSRAVSLQGTPSQSGGDRH